MFRSWLRQPLIVVLIGLSFSTSSRPAAPAEDPVAATVNGVPIHQSEVSGRLQRILPVEHFHKLAPEKIAQYRTQALDAAIADELICQAAEKRKLEIPPAEWDRRVRELDPKLAAQFSPEQVRTAVRRQWLINQMLEREVTAKSKVTPAEVRRYWQDHPQEFVRPEMVQLKMLSLPLPPPVDPKVKAEKKALAESLRQRALAGEDFGQLCRQYSGDPSRVKGGELGWVHRGRLEPPLEAVAFSSLSPGSFSPVVSGLT